MQELETDSIVNIGIPSLVLMERAALAVVACVKVHVQKSANIFIVCGKGNNGADGIAVARLLFQEGYNVTVVTIGDENKATKEYKIQDGIGLQMGIPFCDWKEWTPKQEQWIIDGMFGIGLKRDIQGSYADLIEKIIDSHCEQIIAIDIPSGIDADTGNVLGCAMKAKYTITFGYGKTGLYLNKGRAYVGDLEIAEIGFHDQSIEVSQGPKSMIIEEEDLSRIPTRREDSNKGSYGKILVIAGSVGMSGAAYLSGAAAYRMGAGLVKILTVEENRKLMQMQLPEAIIRCYSETNFEEIIEEECAWATSIVMGPGLGQASYTKKLVKAVLKRVNQQKVKIPIVLDADALNTIANYPELKEYYGPHIVITPHMKEMSRLVERSISELKENPIFQVRNYSKKYGITCVLKDGVSVIANEEEETYLTISGNSALAKGGTGDVLAGVIGGLTCLGMGNVEAAAFGSYIHGRAGKLASEVRGKHGVMSSELLDYLKI